MGFRDNAWLTVWEVKPAPSGRSTQIRASTSKKNRDTDEYETDWSGFITLAGDAHKKAAMLKPKDRIQIKGCEVTTRYVKERDREYTNYTVWDFDMNDSSRSGGGQDRRRENDFSEEDIPF